MQIQQRGTVAEPNSGPQSEGSKEPQTVAQAFLLWDLREGRIVSKEMLCVWFSIMILISVGCVIISILHMSLPMRHLICIICMRIYA